MRVRLSPIVAGMKLQHSVIAMFSGYTSWMEGNKVTCVIPLALVIVSEDLENLGRGLKRDNGCLRYVRQKAHLDCEVRLVRQLTIENIRRELACHIQAVLGKVCGKLVIQ